MFSGRVRTPAVGVMTACLAAVILVGGFAADEVHARNLVNIVMQPGDPDEFESSTPGVPLGEGGKPTVCGDALSEGCGPETDVIQLQVPADDGEAAAHKRGRVTHVIRWMIAEMALKLCAL